MNGRKYELGARVDASLWELIEDGYTQKNIPTYVLDTALDDGVLVVLDEPPTGITATDKDVDYGLSFTTVPDFGS